MLTALEIHDLLLLERAEIELGPGLSVLTGETGAGKSILLDALGLALGRPGRGAEVRPGAARGEAAASFELPLGHPAWELVAEAGIAADPGEELILRRVVTAEGRRTAYVQGRRVPAEALAAIGRALVEIHGQHDERTLTDPRAHRAMLDAFGGLEPLRAEVAAAWRRWREAEAALEARRAELARAEAEEDFLRHALEELEALAPEPGEAAELETRRRLLKAAAAVGEDVARAAAALGAEGAWGQAAEAMRWLERAAPRAEGALDGALAALSAALDALADAERELDTAREAIAADPAELERVEDRLFALRGLARKHAVSPDELPALAADLAARLAAIEAGAEGLAELERARDAAEAAWRRAAEALGAARREAAARLDAAVAAELRPLRLEHARFTTEVAPDRPGPEGAERVTFLVATNPGTPAGPLDRIASGGELSRFLLALKVCLAGGAEAGRVMIFDEIDRGVGGATADAVGRRLARLAQSAQVLVVTHSPQVAARAQRHFRVVKGAEGGTARTRIERLEGEARTEEIARMLAGERITEA
ncbi:MAG: DNA repair protein RecN, partial [Alphaproteobacteria bacterium]